MFYFLAFAELTNGFRAMFGIFCCAILERDT